MHNFRELKIWKESMELVREIYTATKLFPDSEKFGLVSQMNRCSVSIPSNIAEGSSRDSKKEFNHFLNISLGSCFELETQLSLARTFNYVDDKTYSALETKLVAIQKMISGFRKQLIINGAMSFIFALYSLISL